MQLYCKFFERFGIEIERKVELKMKNELIPPTPILLSLSYNRDVSRVRHCVLGRTRFPFGRMEYETKSPIGRRKKKSNVYANYERQEKHANGVFHKEIEHSHFSQRRNDRVT